MELCKEILIKLLENQNVQITFPAFEKEISKAIEKECYKMLNEIRDIVRDNSLNDEDCFLKIEEIVCLFEKNKIDSGIRHDFG